MTPDEIIHELSTSSGAPIEALRAGLVEIEHLRPRIQTTHSQSVTVSRSCMAAE